MSKETYVTSLPQCDICRYEENTPGIEANYDGKTVRGPWANMCERHFASHGLGLGTGSGQRLIVGEKPAQSREDKAAAINRAIEDGDFDAVEDLVGDGDIAEWL